MADYHDPSNFKGPVVIDGPVTINGDVTYSDPPPGVSLDDLVNLTGTGTFQAADLIATDDLTVGDDAAIGGDLAVTGAAAVTGNITSSGTVTGADLVATDDLTVGDDAAVGGDLAVVGAATIGGTLAVTGVLTHTAEPVLPATAPLARRYVSQSIVHGDLTGGAATDTVALTGLPSAAVLIGAYVVTSVETTSGGAGTTGLTLEIGTAIDPDALLGTADIFGAAGRKAASAGALIGGFVDLSGGLLATFTATGGAADIGDISALAVKVIVYYYIPAAE